MKNKIIKILNDFFKEEDKILRKIDGKISYLLFSRNISLEQERKQLLENRLKLSEMLLKEKSSLPL